MKLQSYNVDSSIEWDAPGAFVFAIENASLYQRIVGEFYAQTHGADGCWHAEQAGRALVWNKEVLLWIDYFNMAETEKRIQLKMAERLQRAATEEQQYIETQKTLSVLEKYINDLVDSIDGGPEILPPSLTALLKSVTISWPQSESLLERLVGYADMISSMTNTGLLIIVGISAYLSTEEIGQLWHHCSMRGLYVLDLEPREMKRIGDEKILVIDEDLCEFFT